ncbi:MAG: glucosylceramidase [Clostridia bacterium]|nr:glucosylceramidase [Clostridia bacterium]
MKVVFYVTDQNGKRLTKTVEDNMQYKNTDIIEEQGHPGDVESRLINIHSDVELQTYGGMGGAFSDTAATVWSIMPEDKKAELEKAYFDKKDGIGYTLGRLSIGSCDFSTEDYTYVEEGDETLDTFDISHDKKAVFPFIKAAEKYTELTLFSSPWSPPSYMKTNNSRIGGHLKKECYPLWAKYFRKYIEACKENGINIWGVTMQNEPRHHQIWESCLYTPEEEAAFLGYLGKELEGSGVKILCYDHCRERVYERAKAILESDNGKYCDGIAYHWYSGDHFGELKAFNTKYPDKISIESEGCRAIPGSGIKEEYNLEFAEYYAHDISGCFNNGTHYFCDWNLLVDENNGPFHNREGRGCSVDAPVYYNKETNELIYRLSYYYIGHYSKFVVPGAKVVASSSYNHNVETVAFKNPDGTVVSVLLNRTNQNLPCIVRMDGYIKEFNLDAHSIVTAVIEK